MKINYDKELSEILNEAHNENKVSSIEINYDSNEIEIEGNVYDLFTMEYKYNVYNLYQLNKLMKLMGL